MALTAIEAVRLKSSDKSLIEREMATGTGEDKYFKLKNSNILLVPAIEVTKNSVLQTLGVDYTVNYDQGIVTMTVLPLQGALLEFTYYWSIFSDTEVQYFLDAGSGNTVIATAHLLLAWAADAARLAKRQTLSGGGGLGQVVIDTSVAAKELRATAKALIDTQTELDNSTPAEGFTQIPWTEAISRRERDQHFIREN